MPASPPVERPDLAAVFQRLADALIKVFSERLELAKADAVREAERLLGVAAVLLAGAIAALVGATLAALAAVEALRPLVPGRMSRLLLVAAPLVGGGAILIVRALARRPPAPPVQ